ncbi:MAG: CPBP family intramembrane glutamic endopeptidase [Terracidiphilus sp.]
MEPEGTERQQAPPELEPAASPMQGQPAPRAVLQVAPAWHTVVLVAGVVALSVHGASRFALHRGPVDRLATYAMTALMEAALFGWVLLGLHLGRTPLRSLLGGFSFRPRAVAQDMGVAAVFWIASLCVLGSIGVAWAGVEKAMAHPAPVAPAHGQPPAYSSSQMESLRALKELAPEGAGEIAAWALLCVLVGFVEELVFRGYLQRQFIALARGGLVTGVLLSASVFGAAHAYQGARNMVMLAVFGVLFSVLALYRRSLRAGMMAHCWHDLFAGLALALLKSAHVI